MFEMASKLQKERLSELLQETNQNFQTVLQKGKKIIFVWWLLFLEMDIIDTIPRELVPE